MGDHNYAVDRKPGLKRKSPPENLQDGKQKKFKRDPEDFYSVDPVPENPGQIEDEIDKLTRELESIDEQIIKQEVDIGLEMQEPTDFSEDGDIQVDDNSQSRLTQPRSRRIPRPNRNFLEYEVDPTEERSSAPRPASAYIDTTPRPQTLPSVRRPTATVKTKIGGRGRGVVSAPVDPPVVVPRGRGSKPKGGKWKPPLLVPSWPKSRYNTPAPQKPVSDAMGICSRILRDLMKHKHAWVFNEPVNARAMGLHDYHKIIKRPMDLGTIKSRLSSKFYNNATEFAEDVRLTFKNAITYNPPQNDVHLMAKALLQIFEEKLPKAMEVEGTDPAMKKIHLEQSLTKLKTIEERYQQQLESLKKELEKSKATEIPDISPTPRAKSEVPQSPMTYEEKNKLSQNINTLALKFMKGLFQVFEEEKPELVKSDSEIIDVEIDRIPDQILRRLEAYISDCRTIEQQQKGANGAPPLSNNVSNHNTTSSTATTPISVPAPTSTTKSKSSQPSTTAPTTPATTSTTVKSTASTSTTTTTRTTASTVPTTTAQGQGGKQPLTRPDDAGAESKKKDSDESSSSSDSSSSDSSEDSDSDDDDKKNHSKSKQKNSTPANVPITTTTPTTVNGVHNVTTSTTTTTTSQTNTTNTIPAIAVMSPKPFILPTQKEEKQVVIKNADSWSGFVSGELSGTGGISGSTKERKTTPDVSEAAAQLSVLASLSEQVPQPAIQLSQSQPVSVPGVPPSLSSSLPSADGGSVGGDGFWEDVRKRAALNKQRERDRAELEAVIQRQLEEEKLKLEKEAQARRQVEEERKKQEQYEEQQRQLAKEREMELLREAERAKREKVAPSVNLTSQSEFMASLGRGIVPIGSRVDMTSLLGLKRRSDDD